MDEVDVKHTIYEVPLQLHEQKIDAMICKLLALPNPEIDLSEWEKYFGNSAPSKRHPQSRARRQICAASRCL